MIVVAGRETACRLVARQRAAWNPVKVMVCSREIESDSFSSRLPLRNTMEREKEREKMEEAWWAEVGCRLG